MPARQTISKAVGIDLGTTNSAVGIMDPTDTGIVVHRDEVTRSETTPSCVWKDPKTGEIVVGRRAARRQGTTPEPIRSVKRLMGSPSTVRLTDEDVTPVQVSAHILREMKRQIEQDVAPFADDRASWVVDRAVVTVPAYFDLHQIEATRDAGEQAGLSVLDLLHEPTAAACYHCWRTDTSDGVFLVYDFGGGTFDVAIVRCRAGAFDVVGVSGNPHLGGDDLDMAIADDLRERLVRDGYALDLDPGNDEDRLRATLLRRVAESVKIGLTTSGEFLLRDAMGLTDQDGQPVTGVDMMFERPAVEAVLRPIVERTVPYCFDALEQAHERADVTLADVDAVVLAGGSTHMPLVREIVGQHLCAGDRAGPFVDPRADQPRARSTEPVYESVDSIVARGAVIRAAVTGGLAVTDPEGAVRVSFRGLGATGRATTHVGGTIEALAPGVDLAGGSIAVSIPSFGFQDEQDITESGTFGFSRLPLQPSAENLLDFEVRDGSGAVVATVGRTVAQDPDVRPSGLDTGTAVVSKALDLEVLRDGTPYRRTLVEALASLPTARDFEFLHPGDTEVVRLPIYQNKHRIKEIRVPVPVTLPRGTTIGLNIQVDELSFITVTGAVGQVEFSASVEPPPPPQPPAPDEVAGLDRRFEESVHFLPPGQGNVARLKYERAHAALEAARRRGDEEAAIRAFEEMDDVVASLDEAQRPLEPPKAVLDGLVRECDELHRYAQHVVGRAGGASEPYDATEMRKSIDAQRTEGERAFAASDQQAYSEVIVTLRNLRHHLQRVIARIEAPSRQQVSARQQAIELLRAATGKADELADVVAATSHDDLRAEVHACQQELNQLQGELDHHPDRVLERGQQVAQKLIQIENRLAAQTRPDHRGGLVIDPNADGRPAP